MQGILASSPSRTSGRADTPPISIEFDRWMPTKGLGEVLSVVYAEDELINCRDEFLINAWLPVARSEELVPAHIFHARLLGEELAVWRDGNGTVNVWQNRCPHRGTRLTIGLNLGSELRCQYHGLRYATVSGQCVSIPAHPGVSPSQHLRAKSYSVCNRYGLIWVCLGMPRGELDIEPLNSVGTTTIRSIVIRASAALVAENLMEYSFIPSARLSEIADEGDMHVTARDAWTLVCTSSTGSAKETIVLVVQPADQGKSIVHGIVDGRAWPGS